MHEIKACIEKHIGQRYGLTVEVKEPKNTSFNAVKVDKWQVTVETAPAQRNLPRQRIKIEIANVPAYTRELVPLRSNYEFLQGYDSVLVNAESLAEVMAANRPLFNEMSEIDRNLEVRGVRRHLSAWAPILGSPTVKTLLRANLISLV